MTEDIMLWLIFFLIMMPSYILFNCWYSKTKNPNVIVSFVVGAVIGVMALLISLYVTGEI